MRAFVLPSKYKELVDAEGGSKFQKAKPKKLKTARGNVDTFEVEYEQWMDSVQGIYTMRDAFEKDIEHAKVVASEKDKLVNGDEVAMYNDEVKDFELSDDEKGFEIKKSQIGKLLQTSRKRTRRRKQS